MIISLRRHPQHQGKKTKSTDKRWTWPTLLRPQTRAAVPTPTRRHSPRKNTNGQHRSQQRMRPVEGRRSRKQNSQEGRNAGRTSQARATTGKGGETLVTWASSPKNNHIATSSTRLVSYQLLM